MDPDPKSSSALAWGGIDYTMGSTRVRAGGWASARVVGMSSLWISENMFTANVTLSLCSSPVAASICLVAPKPYVDSNSNPNPNLSLITRSSLKT